MTDWLHECTVHVYSKLPACGGIAHKYILLINVCQITDFFHLITSPVKIFLPSKKKKKEKTVYPDTSSFETLFSNSLILIRILMCGKLLILPHQSLLGTSVLTLVL